MAVKEFNSLHEKGLSNPFTMVWVVPSGEENDFSQVLFTAQF